MENPYCPDHGDEMDISRYGGFWCKVKGCKQRVDDGGRHYIARPQRRPSGERSPAPSVQTQLKPSNGSSEPYRAHTIAMLSCIHAASRNYQGQMVDSSLIRSLAVDLYKNLAERVMSGQEPIGKDPWEE